MNLNRLFLQAHGRMSQRDYWMAAGLLLIASIVTSAIPLVGTVVALALIYPWLCVVAKRLHDTGRSGQLAIAVVALAAVASVLGALGGALLGAAFALVVSSISSLACLAFLVWLGLAQGDPVANAYGEPAAVSASGT